LPLLFNVIEFTGSASFSLEFLSLLVLPLVAHLELEAEAGSLMSWLLSPPPFNSGPSGLNAGGRLIPGPFALVDVGFLFVLLSISLISELELEQIDLGCFFVAGIRAFSMTFDLGTETSADDASVLLFLRF
jgi:hypothetical protein